jgi:elongation factor P
MVASNHLSPGMTISLKGKLYRVESCVKVSVPQGAPFIKAKLRDLTSNDLVEKSFKLNQEVEDVALAERRLEFLYLEERDYLFLDIGNLEQILVPQNIVGNKMNYLKEGVEVRASFYGSTIFSIELPQFLELMVANAEQKGEPKIAILETGAKIEVPLFIEIGDIIKVDTRTDEYVQRV